MRWVVWLTVGALWACGGSRPQGPSDAGSGSGGGGGDGGTDGGVAADCAGLAPASLGTAFTFDVTSSAGATCSGATGDDGGTLAARAVFPNQAIPTWSERSSSGAQTGAFDAYAVVPQDKGFIALTETPPQRYLQYFDSFGGVGSPPVPPVPVDANGVLGPGFHGGAVVLSSDASGLHVRRFAPDLSDTGSATVTGSFTARGAAEDASGSILALVGSGTAVQGLWVDLAKGTAGAPFSLGSANSIVAHPLADGGVALRLDGRWTSVVTPSGVSSPPGWMAQDTDFAPIRSAKGYAVVHGDGSADIVSKAGNACATLKFPASDLAVGMDGTVVGATSGSGCTKVFWPALLK